MSGSGVERVFDGPTAAFIVSAMGDELQMVDEKDLAAIVRDGLRLLPTDARLALLRQACADAGLRVLSAEQAEMLLAGIGPQAEVACKILLSGSADDETKGACEVLIAMAKALRGDQP